MPEIDEPTDAVVRITTTTICGTDLHILQGDVPGVQPGRILGHEGVGVVEAVGSAVSSFQSGDRVLISCITSCGKCHYCRRQMYSQCRDGGWMLGHTIDGTQAEYVRVPHADTSLYHLPAAANAEACVMLSDVLPTGFECGVLRGQVAPGDTVAIVGAGPIGLGALLTAQFYAPAEVIVVDIDSQRLEVARALGATRIVNSSAGTAVDLILELTGGAGVDVAIEAVGIPTTFDICQSIIAPGGRIANVGVHGTSVLLRLERLWSRNITIATSLVDTSTTARLLAMVESRQLDPSVLVTHRFRLAAIMDAYDMFANPAAAGALKVVLTSENPAAESWDAS